MHQRLALVEGYFNERHLPGVFPELAFYFAGIVVMHDLGHGVVFLVEPGDDFIPEILLLGFYHLDKDFGMPGRGATGNKKEAYCKKKIY